MEQQRVAEQSHNGGEQISMSGELYRKLIHLSSLGVPLIYWFVDQQTMLMLLVPATIFSIGIEITRRSSARFDAWFRSIFGAILRPHERSGSSDTGRRSAPEINGATFVLLSATLAVALFPKSVALTSFTVLIISDTAAALIGRRFGRHPIAGGRFGGKSLEGSTAFFITALGVLLFFGFFWVEPRQGAAMLSPFLIAGAASALLATFVELVSQGGSTIDDNITIPIAFGGLQWLLLSLLVERI